MASKTDMTVLGVATVAGGMMASDALAAPVRVDNANIIVANAGTGNVDVNGDSVNDVSVTNQNNAKNGQNRYYLNAVSGNSAYATTAFPTDPGFPVRPLALQPGAIVGSGLTFGLDSGGLSNTLAGSGLGENGTLVPTNAGLFATNGSVNYIGLSITPASGGTFYGYVGVSLTPAGASAASIATIVNYGYETDAFTAISTPVPEPTSLAALALGAGALLARRRETH